jgi:hypothetical protein
VTLLALSGAAVLGLVALRALVVPLVVPLVVLLQLLVVDSIRLDGWSVLGLDLSHPRRSLMSK